MDTRSQQILAVGIAVSLVLFGIGDCVLRTSEAEAIRKGSEEVLPLPIPQPSPSKFRL